MRRLLTGILFSCAATLAGAQAPGGDASLAQRRNEIREMAFNALVILYQLSPGANLVVERAAGYAVFGVDGTNAGPAGASAGKGVAVNNATKAQTFMQMAQAGSGQAARNRRLIFVFDTPEALRDFVAKGWESAAQAGAAPMVAERGGRLSGAVTLAPGVHLYQLNDSVVSPSIALGGAKFSADPALN